MEQVTTLFPPAFPALALAHFMALLSPGPDFFLLVGYAVRYRLRGSVGLCLGIAAGNGLYILLVVIGSGLLRQTPLLFTIIEPLGAAYLLWGGPSTVEKPRRAAGVAVRRIGMSVTGKTTITGARFIAVESEKCSVLSGANDRPAGPKRDRYTAGHMWNLDDQRSVTLGSAADNAYRPAANSTSPG